MTGLLFLASRSLVGSTGADGVECGGDKREETDGTCNAKGEQELTGEMFCYEVK